jgi:hypothetical protein
MHLTRSSFLRRSAFLVMSAVVIGGCTDFSDPPDILGKVFVSAKDQNGAGVGGINFTLLLNDRSTQWAKVVTSSNGTAEFRADDGGVLAQTYIVRFDALNGTYKLAAGETNDKPVNVIAGQEFTITFNVTKEGPGGP